MNINVTKYEENFYILDNGMVREFLFTGSDDAVLVDTGIGDESVKKIADTLTNKPIKVVLTHGDTDHTGGLGDFTECWINKADKPMLKQKLTVHELNEGDIIKAGSFKFEVIEIPGHTYGSICLLDRDKKLLIAGDTIQKNNPVFMYGEQRNIDLYIKSLEKLSALTDSIDTIIPCHGDYPFGSEYITYCLNDARSLKNGTLPVVGQHPFAHKDIYKGRYCSFLY